MRQRNYIVICIVTCLFITSFSGCIETFTKIEKTIYVSHQGNSDYTSIQAAIDAASNNDTIMVSEGIYKENLFINKSISLIGSSAKKTIIDGGNISDVIYLGERSHIHLQGFTIKNSGSEYNYPNYDAGINIHSKNNSIHHNIITQNSIGIFSYHATFNIYENNTIQFNTDYGIYLYSYSNNNIIRNNMFTNNFYALRIKGTEQTTIIKNIFDENQRGLYFCCGSKNNHVYHNNFLNNSDWNAKDYTGQNNWDSGYPMGGNYWTEYSGKDLFSGKNQHLNGSDGIGDIPYEINSDGVKNDRFPLMQPVSIQSITYE